jgi:hypothetical protein
MLAGARASASVSRVNRIVVAAGAIGLLTGTGCAPTPSEPSTAPPVTSPALGAPPPGLPITDGATIAVTANGFDLHDVRIVQGSRLTFTNNDAAPHEILSDPFHVHTDCPEINRVGFIVPGQSRQSDAFLVARACGFHDHAHEGDLAFHGVVYIEERQSP